MLTDSLQTSSNPRDIERKEILVDVNVACRTTLDILNDLLCFDKMESGILVVHKHEVPVLSFISDCVGMFSAQAKEANVTISINNSDNVICSDAMATSLLENDIVLIDKFKMDQVLRNLISNALKFTPRGGSVTVTSNFVPDSMEMHLSSRKFDTDHDKTHCELATTYRNRSREGTWRSITSVKRKTSAQVHSDTETDSDPIIYTIGKLIITVKDSGTGMLEKDYSRLFKEIVQFNPEVLQAGGGSGLGLWITKGIVDLHQGEISVYSEGLGYGSSFTVKLPMRRQAFGHPATSLSTPSTRSCASAPKRSSSFFLGLGFPMQMTDSKIRVDDDDVRPVYHILVVDDSPLNRKMLVRTFKMSGYICDEAEDGLIAVAKVKEMMASDAKAYSAILMDFVMPNMDGPTATKEIRALGYTAPIFGVTGNTLDSDKKCFTDSGADRVLPKPFDINIFDRAMQCA